MALRQQIDLPPFTPPAAGQTTTIDIPTSGTYYDINLEYRESGVLVTEANMIAAITEITVKLNGEPVRRYDATDLIAYNALHGITYQNGYLPIFFAEPWARNAASEDLFAWGMADINNFQIDVKIASGRTAPTIAATCTRTNENRNLGAIKKVRKYNVPVAATGVHNFSTIPLTEDFLGIHCESTDVDRVRVTADNNEIFDLLDEQISQHLTNIPHLTPQSSWTHVMFNQTGRLEDRLPVAVPTGKKGVLQRLQSFQVDFTMGAATPFDALVETLGTLN